MERRKEHSSDVLVTYGLRGWKPPFFQDQFQKYGNRCLLIQVISEDIFSRLNESSQINQEWKVSNKYLSGVKLASQLVEKLLINIEVFYSKQQP